MTMVVSENTVVSLEYQLKLDNAEGEVIETVPAERPLQFLFGAGRLLKDFEAELNGLNANDSFEFTLSPDKAYGEIDKNAIVELPKTIFMVDGVLKEDLIQLGKTVPMRDSNGNNLNGVVVAIEDEHVTMDFNHPMAGKTLHFAGKVTDLREATAIEVESKMLESELAAQAGGCGSGGCGSGSCGPEEHASAGGGCGSGSCGCS